MIRGVNSINNKKGFQFSFAWMFAIIAGIVIIFLAVYASTKILRTGEYEQSTKAAKELTTIFDPLETSIESTKAGTIRIGEEIRVYDDCFNDGSFGRQRFSIAGKKSFSEEYGERGAGTEISNKYIFTESVMEGKEYTYITKPFNLPFKVADTVVLTTRNYCFIQAPTYINEEIENLGLEKIRIAKNAGECETGEVKVCFLGAGSGGTGGVNCEIRVNGQGGNFDAGYTDKGSERVYYQGELIYASIMSDKRNYECNLKRLMMRTNNQAILYLSEAQYLSGKGCTSGVELQLDRLSTAISNYSTSVELVTKVLPAVKEIKPNNICNLW